MNSPWSIVAEGPSTDTDDGPGSCRSCVTEPGLMTPKEPGPMTPSEQVVYLQ
jgi:hypothetical protein